MMLKPTTSFLFILLAISSLTTNALSQEKKTLAFDQIILQLSPEATSVEQKVGQLLMDRIREKTDISILPYSEQRAINAHTLHIVLGKPDQHPTLAQIFTSHRIPALSELAPGPEGFLLQVLPSEDHYQLILAGVDDRGCLYSVGELLRQLTYQDKTITLPQNLKIRTAPAFEIRGTQFGQSHIAKRISGVRDWTTTETERVILDYALAGANVFPTRSKHYLDFIKSYGLMVETNFGANTAGTELPLEWQAAESIGRKGYACLSVPEAKAYMIEKCETYFKSSPTFDFVKFHGGDGGGCECDRCEPYGQTFIEVVEAMASIIHKYHPNTKVYFTNQKFDNADDEAIFNYLNEKPRTWLWAWGYGPGSDATTWQPGHRQTHRMDLFRYPGFGPYGLYPKEIIQRIPARHPLVYYNEITHWKYAQHAYIQMYPRADRNGDLPPHWSHEIYNRRPDQYLTMVYNRLTFFAWPEYYHRVFNDLMRYGIGDITHSSGHHDHFNQWMWQRLLWSPRRTVEDLIQEYCETWFGPEAGPYMAQALPILEKNIEEHPDLPLDQKSGIDEFYQLVEKAGQVMPAKQKAQDWLWRMFMQKAALDKYVQLDVQQQKQLLRKIELAVDDYLNQSSSYDLAEIRTWAQQPEPTIAMQKLKRLAQVLGEESNQLFGQRVDGYFNLDHDYVGLGWLQRQLERALKANPSDSHTYLQRIVDYENPGPGGFYDNLGTFNLAPNVVQGYPYDHGQPYVADMLSEGNRPSQRSMHFTQDEAQGVTLQYRDLDPNAEYEIEFTFVRPWYQDRYADRMNQTAQAIFADDHMLTKSVELPLQMSDFFTYVIPKSVTADGQLTIRLEKAEDVANGDRVTVEQWRNSGGWGTMVSEVWLRKK